MSEDKDKEIEREIVKVTADDIEDYTDDSGSWDIHGEIYHFVKDILVPADGEGHDVIIQRESDKKFFRFCWCLTRSETYRFYDDFTEVFEKVETVTIKTYV